MRKRKRPGSGLGVLFLTAALVCASVLPVFAEEEGADSTGTEVSGTETTGSTLAAPDAAGQTGEGKAEVEENDAAAAKEIQENGAGLEALSEGTTEPCVTADSVTWEGGKLRIPVDLGSYTADDLEIWLNLEPENSESGTESGTVFSETWYRLSIDGDYVFYSLFNNVWVFEEPFWTKQGSYGATLEFRSTDGSEEIISRDEFTVVIPISSEIWQPEEKLVKFDGSQNVTFSFKNGTNYCEFKSINSVQIDMWNTSTHEHIGAGGFGGSMEGMQYDMEAGTIVFDKDALRAALVRVRQSVTNNGKEITLPVNTYLHVRASNSAGERADIDYEDFLEDKNLFTSSWELDLTDFDWKMPEVKIVPEITDNTYTIGDHEGAAIVCTGELEDFVSVYMDGEEVDRSNYTLESGSTILTFTTKYLNTLSVGKHTVTMNYTYGSVDTELTVLSNTTNTEPGGSSGGSSGNSSGGSSGSLPSGWSSGSTNKPKPNDSTSTTPAAPSEPAGSATPANPTVTTPTTGAAAPAGTANTGNVSESTTSVQTGDNTTVMLWVLTAMIAFGTCGVMGWKRYSSRF